MQAIVVKSHALRNTARTLQPVAWRQQRQQQLALTARAEEASADPAADEHREGAGTKSAATATSTDAPRATLPGPSAVLATAPSSHGPLSHGTAGGETAASSETELDARAASARAARERARALHLPGSDPVTRERLRTALAARHAGVAVVLENWRASVIEPIAPAAQSFVSPRPLWAPPLVDGSSRKENVAQIVRTAECLGVCEVHLVYTADAVVVGSLTCPPSI